CDGDQYPGCIRGRGCCRFGLSPGSDVGGQRLHGSPRRREISRQARGRLTADALSGGAMNQLAEHREYPRMAIDCDIAWRAAGSSAAGSGIARNLSGNGVLFVAPQRPGVGERLEITLSPGVLSIPALSALVEVVRVEPE